MRNSHTAPSPFEGVNPASTVEDACQSDRGDTSAVRTAYRRGDNACRIHGFPFLWRASRAKIWRPLSKTLEQKTVSAGLQPPGRMASGMHAHLSNLRARVRIFRAQKFACSEQEKACVLACGQGSGTLVGLGPGKAAKRGRAPIPLQRSSTSAWGVVATAGSWQLCNWVLRHLIRDSATLAVGGAFQLLPGVEREPRSFGRLKHT